MLGLRVFGDPVGDTYKSETGGQTVPAEHWTSGGSPALAGGKRHPVYRTVSNSTRVAAEPIAFRS